MTELRMERAARAAGTQTRAIALYHTRYLTMPELAPLILAASFSGLLWTLTIARILNIIA